MTENIQIKFKRLDNSIECAGFDCGEQALNNFLSLRALNEMSQRLSVTTVALDEKVTSIIGFYSISPTQIAKASLSNREGRGVPYNLVPGIRIGRLAIDKNYQGKGFGAKLLKHALQKCFKMSEEFGGRVIVVDAKNDIAAAFYERYGFKSIKDDPLLFVLKISTLFKVLDISTPQHLR